MWMLLRNPRYQQKCKKDKKHYIHNGLGHTAQNHEVLKIYCKGMVVLKFYKLV